MRFVAFVVVLLVSSTAAAQVDLSSLAVEDNPKGSNCGSVLPQFEAPVSSAIFDELKTVKAKPWQFRDAYKRAACTGYSCGCYDAEAACMANCPPQGQPGHLDCMTDCGRQSRRCAICCCCTPTCPEYCS
jgi:hypothetical protein